MVEAIRPRIYELEFDIRAGRIDISFEKKYDSIAVREKVTVFNRWPEDNRGQGFVLEPGVLLRRKWQGFTKKEKAEFVSLSERGLIDKKASLKFKKIQIAESIKDLKAGLRQSFRHIPRQLNYLKVDAEGKEIIKGEAVFLTDLVEKADRISLVFSRPEKFGLKAIERAIGRITPLRQRLERVKNAYKKEVTQHWGLAQQLARQGKRAQAALEMSKAKVKLAQHRTKIAAQVDASLELGEKRMELYKMGGEVFTWAYNELKGLIIRAQRAKSIKDSGRNPSQKEILSIGEEGIKIRQRLKATPACLFNPFYERIDSDEVRSLEKVLEHAQAGEVDTMFNLFNNAQAKLEALVLGEIPTEEEIGELEKARL